MRTRLIITSICIAAAMPSWALADEPADPPTLDRNLFIASAAVTTVALATVVYSIVRMNGAEDDKHDALARSEDLRLWVDDNGLEVADACATSRKAAVIEGDPQTARDVDSACDAGERWEKIDHYVALPLTGIGLVATGVFAYRYFSRDESRVHVTPVVTPSTTGAQLSIDF